MRSDKKKSKKKNENDKRGGGILRTQEWREWGGNSRKSTAESDRRNPAGPITEFGGQADWSKRDLGGA